MKAGPQHSRWLPYASALLLLSTMICVVVVARRPADDLFHDLKQRHGEMRCLEAGVYPNKRLHGGSFVAHTVYPPTSLAQLWLASPFHSFTWNAGFYLLLSAGALVILGRHAWSLGSVAGRSGSWLALSALLAMQAVLSSLKLGQHGLIVSALLVLMSSALAQKKTVWAGVAWAGAMIKPQMALAFLGPCVARRAWASCVVGVLLLAVCAAAVCAFTGHTVWQVLHASYGQSPLAYAGLGDTLISLLSKHLGIGSHAATLLAACLAALLLLPYLVPPLARLPPLIHLAAAGVAGRLGFYHLHYDDVMLSFLLLGLIQHALWQNTRSAWAVVACVGMTLWTPNILLERVPGHSLRQLAWVLALVYLTHAALKRLNASATSAPGEPGAGGSEPSHS